MILTSCKHSADLRNESRTQGTQGTGCWAFPSLDGLACRSIGCRPGSSLHPGAPAASNQAFLSHVSLLRCCSACRHVPAPDMQRRVCRARQSRDRPLTTTPIALSAAVSSSPAAAYRGLELPPPAGLLHSAHVMQHHVALGLIHADNLGQTPSPTGA